MIQVIKAESVQDRDIEVSIKILCIILFLLYLVINMDSYYFLILAVLHSCFAYAQSVSHPGKCRHVFRSDEVQVICASVNFKQLPSKAFPGNTTDLSVHSSNLSSITSDDLRILSHLRQLSLISNQL